MKNQNSFAITGFVVNPSEKTLTNSSATSFAISVNRTDNVNGEKKRTSALLRCENWHKNGTPANPLLVNKALVTIKGFFKPNEWTDKAGNKHSDIILVVTEVEDPNAEQPE